MLRLDAIDHNLLAALVENSRESFATLGQRVGLSTAATKRRVDRLRSEGVIRRFSAEVEPTALGWTIEAFVELYCEGRVPPDRMRDLVRAIPEVVEAYTVTGESDGILRVRAADTQDFEKVLGVIRNHPGVNRTRSALVLSRL
ncbi:DNA-binding Lrp family transcriptional regulator [Marmoricola sp. OAE513]|uniref:Lrp/AsnC family transcriptional regulator n=1 Tax=Marmoricola sp. OAE513 TaxID=2817894 RepID=UPI00339348A4